MAEKNVVTAGAYKGAKLVIRGIMSKELRLEEQKLFGAKRFALTRQTVRKVGIVDTDSTKSASSAILRGGAGVVLLGPIGIAAALSAKNKKTHQVMITFSDNKESMAVIDNEVLTMLQDLILNAQGADAESDYYEEQYGEPEESEPTPQTQATTPASNIAEQLAQLAALKNAGALTEEEFAKAKARLLNGPDTASEASTQHKRKELYKVVLNHIAEHGFAYRINLIKAINEVSNLEPKDVKNSVDNLPGVIAYGVSKEKAEEILNVVQGRDCEAEIIKIVKA